jgi:hypothetical protein
VLPSHADDIAAALAGMQAEREDQPLAGEAIGVVASTCA